MLAVIELWGNQFMVQKWDIIEVKKQNAEVGTTISSTPLLVSDLEWNDTKVGTPFVDGAKVELKVLDQSKGKKVRVFKMKSKKRQMKNNWFRPSITQLEVLSIS